MTHLNSQAREGFRRLVYRFWSLAGRKNLPWRLTTNPYHILVSELMLQQTQVDRVIPKFKSFIAEFPTFKSLATTPSSSVIRHWQGLGYNRRALNLQRAAQVVENTYGGELPQTLDDLLTLPGVGPYTASAVTAFAFNQPVVVLETNIRTVYIYHFFPAQYLVSDEVLLPFIEQTLDQSDPRVWYSALMDYGSFLKQVMPNPSRKSKHYVKQTPLAGSNREARGLILKLVAQGPTTSEKITEMLHLDKNRIENALQQLESEHFLRIEQGLITLIE